MIVYADYAATTPMRAVAKAAMLECLEDFGNPSSIHSAGRMAAVKMESARKDIAELLNCRPSEIFFTAGGTEANNWAFRGTPKVGHHIVTSAFEHHSVLHSVEVLENVGYQVDRIMPDASGIVDPEAIERAAEQRTVSLISIMAANNEIGTIQPIADIAKAAHTHHAIFHTDAVQAVGHIPVDVQKQGLDMLSLSAHKFGGPKGVGALYCNSGIKMRPMLSGGGQERGLRPGTENVPGIVAMAAAMREACEHMETENQKIRRLCEKLIEGICAIPGSHIHGSLDHRLPGTVNCSFDGVEGEALVLILDLAGVCVSAGSACTSGTGEPSHVLTAIGLSRRDAYGAIRITLGELSTAQEVAIIRDQLDRVVAELRS